MATIAPNFLLALLMAVQHFGASEAEIRLDFIDPVSGRVEVIRLVPTTSGSFDALTFRDGQWLRFAPVSRVPMRENVFKLGDPGVEQTIDLAAAVPDLAKAGDAANLDLKLEAQLGVDKVVFHQVRSGEVIHLVDAAGKVSFALHLEKPAASPAAK